MTIIKIKGKDNYHPIESQSHRTENWMGDEWIEVPEELEYKLNGGYCELKVENGTLIDIIQSLNLVDIDLHEYKKNKLGELSYICNKSIANGFDIELLYISGHVSLMIEDQINLSTAYNSILQGAAQYPYHLDGQLCQMFSADDIEKIAQAATTHKLYHTTYFNHLKAWIERCETKEEIDAISYGSKLPEDLAANMESIISAASNL